MFCRRMGSLFLALVDGNSGNALIDPPGVQIPGRDATKCQYCPFVNPHTGANHGVRTDPDFILDCNRFYDEIKAGFLPIVAAGTKISVLGNTAMVAYFNACQIVHPSADPN